MTNDPKDPFEEAMAQMGLTPEDASQDREDADWALFEEAMASTDTPERGEDPVASQSRPRAAVHSPRGLRRLIRQGVLSPAETLDLHQMTREQALRATGAFLSRSRREGHQLVRVICGRGLHSKDGAVLPGALDGWLKGALSEHVTLSMPAPGNDGGEGARYVLLRS